MKRILSCLVIFVLFGAMVDGCESDRERVARLSQEAAARQAEQNREIARLVESQQSLQHEIETQHQHLDEQRTALETELREIANQRFRDPIIANALIGAAILAASALPLVLAFFVLRGAHQAEPDDAALTELLVQELVAEEPHLLPRPTAPAIEEQPLQVETALRAPGGS
jgi:hypothetical protein